MEQKKSPLIPVLIVITVILLIGVGILLFFLMKGDSDDSTTNPVATTAPPNSGETAENAETTENNENADNAGNTEDVSDTGSTQDVTEGESNQNSSVDGYTGTYKTVATAMDGHYVDMRGVDSGSGLEITLNADGTGVFRMINAEKSEDNKVTWKVEGENIRFYDEKTGTDIIEASGEDASFTIKDGLLWYNVSGGNTILARDGADLSGLDLLTPEEFYEKYGDEIREKRQSGEY